MKKLILLVFLISACESMPPDTVVSSETDCIDTGESVECASYAKDVLKRATDKEALGFDETPKQ